MLDVLLKEFKKDTGINVNVLAQGLSQALKTSEMEEADIIIVHFEMREKKFINR